ncbi:MAG: Unknown protein [uncultured Thiotrichaceae bacterium]|uniref:DUF2237 domain-containing protein n=1 Tax=uncultured Thiotrichaceae bacterium TaxID=298394 RepID=A0A6S6T2V2_9GAMM|nr:MAG: Unknown protein [uncultured Thiotrichaceae bacterium]
MSQAESLNVLGLALEVCGKDPLTGFYRDGNCTTGKNDVGSHTVCVKVTEDFLVFSQANGNDLSTPVPEYDFSGLKPGDKWCLCATRWKQAFDAGVAPSVYILATNQKTLKYVELDDLKRHAIDLS